ncbi:TRAP transporter small permease subunit [Paracoccus sp. YIM 132242]|uniref:TRAP transporter small permease protein n=1 Tax=Paracoccus lichenicola TaxID=2665644 RepID=A0A6L6HQ73_9RHOB|nr:TRAP transporter small permease subunit [Paracoccus lichenicola]MTE01324.1 TRAP transporter small permease subunit [Paracoccus lichenicola]
MTPGSALQRLSRAVMRAEAALGGILVGAILLLLLANVVSRSAGRPLIWTDELAVHLMVVLALVGASLGIAMKGHMAIGLLPDRLGPRGRAGLALLADLSMLGFLLVMAGVLWRWFDLPGLLRAGSGAALAAESFNFVYTDPTNTLGLRKIWFWLALPLTCATALLHCLAALHQDIGALRA